MKNITRDTFQGMCLQAYDGRQTIALMDYFSPEIRKRIAESPFNLCPACIYDKTLEKTPQGFIQTIERFEATIRSTEKTDVA